MDALPESRSIRLWAAALCLLLTSAAFAGGTSTASVRVINALAGPTNALLGEQAFGSVKAHTATAYRTVESGEAAFVGGGAQARLTVEAGQHYSVVVSNAGPVLLRDELLGTATQAQISFYNLAGPGSFELRSGDETVIAGVAYRTRGTRAVDAGLLELTAVATGATPTGLGPLQVEVGKRYSFLLFRDAGSLEAVWIDEVGSLR